MSPEVGDATPAGGGGGTVAAWRRFIMSGGVDWHPGLRVRQKRTYRLLFPSPEDAARLRRVVADFLDPYLPAGELHDFTVASNEAVINGIRHGAMQPVWITERPLSGSCAVSSSKRDRPDGTPPGRASFPAVVRQRAPRRLTTRMCRSSRSSSAYSSTAWRKRSAICSAASPAQPRRASIAPCSAKKWPSLRASMTPSV